MEPETIEQIRLAEPSCIDDAERRFTAAAVEKLQLPAITWRSIADRSGFPAWVREFR
jgi:hypothetical protein